MKAEELRQKSDAELLQEMNNLKDELFDLRFKQAVGSLEDTARMKTVKKSIARIKTILTERERAQAA